jgi:guanine deaminase
MDEKAYMEMAVRKAREGVDAGQSPFGAVVVKNGKVVAASHNTVWKDCDPTAHAEVNAIRQASAALKSIDLAGAVMYTTCEPCPMCLTAIHWAKIDRVVFGATIADADTAGFTELTIAAKDMVRLGGSPLKVDSGLLQTECADLFHYWLAAAKGKSY